MSRPLLNNLISLRLLLVEAAISCVHVFDASASPLLYIPLLYLTAPYFVSMLEMLALSRFLRYLRRPAKNIRSAQGRQTAVPSVNLSRLGRLGGD
jgi:hypothetical protein